jgi:uncharacterized protein YndB with AHSA1/START domain
MSERIADNAVPLAPEHLIYGHLFDRPADDGSSNDFIWIVDFEEQQDGRASQGRRGDRAQGRRLFADQQPVGADGQFPLSSRLDGGRCSQMGRATDMPSHSGTDRTFATRREHLSVERPVRMTHELKYERGFDASPDQVFEAFTTHRGQRAMFQQDARSWLFESDLDLRVGGRWEVASGLSRDELYRFTHIFREIDRPRRLTFSVNEHGPGGPSFDSGRSDVRRKGRRNGKSVLAGDRARRRSAACHAFGVWLDDTMYFTAGPNTQKAVNLARNAHCAVATVGDILDLIVEGEVRRVRDQAILRRVADAYDAKYGWPLTIRSDGAFDAPYSAPSAGPPPYLPYRLTPTTAFGLGMKEPYGATRWRFSGD